MNETNLRVPAVPGWFTTSDPPHLLGSRCSLCRVVAFPPRPTCPNPRCRATAVKSTPLARQGRIWSYTDAQYQPPAPYISAFDPYRPFVLAAVALDEDGLIVLGQMVDGCAVEDVHVGLRVELTVEPLVQTDACLQLMWRWRPLETVDA